MGPAPFRPPAALYECPACRWVQRVLVRSQPPYCRGDSAAPHPKIAAVRLEAGDARAPSQGQRRFLSPYGELL